AIFFLPSYIKWFTNFETLTSLNTGSGNTTRFFGFAFLIFYNKLSFLFLVAVLYIFNEVRRPHLLNPISLSNKREPVFDTNSLILFAGFYKKGILIFYPLRQVQRLLSVS